MIISSLQTRWCLSDRKIYITTSYIKYHMEYNIEEEMMPTFAKARRVGGSFVVTIPAIVAKAENIQEDDIVEIKVRKKRKSYFGVLKGIGKFTEEDEFRGQLDE